ncbi:MAG: hypothetical protein KJ709_02575 [Nanoarchaeota archaeon]|nr:hypothetical protein [Nanoarchaeota archaeon]
MTLPEKFWIYFSMIFMIAIAVFSFGFIVGNAGYRTYQVQAPGGGGGGGYDEPQTNPLLFQVFPVNEEDSGVDGHTFCIDHGYSHCIAEEVKQRVYYYESTDGSCTDLQYMDTITHINPCYDTVYEYSGEVNCRRTGPSVEPHLGDQKWDTYTETVICSN